MSTLKELEKRLALIERFAKALTRDSLFVKASANGKILASNMIEGPADRAIAQRAAGFAEIELLDRRVKQLERGGGSAAHAEGERVLAKAADMLKSGDDILAKATNTPGIDSVQVGVISSHVSSGNLQEARQVLLDALNGLPLAKAADPVNESLNAVGGDEEQKADEVREAVALMQRTLAALVERLDRIEARQRAPRPAAVPTTVAKATQQRQQRRLSPEDFDSYLDSYVDNPTRVGELLEMRRSSDPTLVRQAEQYLIAAKRKFEVQKVRQDQRGFGQ